MSSKKIRPSIRFGENQYKLIQKRLDERGVSFQQYCLELICQDLNVPVKEFQEVDEKQISLDLFNDDVA